MTNKKTRIEIQTTKVKLAADREQTIDLLVRITPPEVDPGDSKRPALNLGVVLDRSGSMQGRKMQEAKEAAKYCIDQLLTTDRLSVVIFDDSIDILIPSQKVANKDLLKRALDTVHSDGSTALHEAWVRGGLQVSEHLDDDAVNRVLLITDGQANVGETNVDRIVSQAAELAARGVSTTTIGIGRDFNEELLLPMAEAGQGNGWHVKEAEDMRSIFEVELKGLVTQIGHSVTFGIKPKNGVSVLEILNDFEVDGSGRSKLPNLQAGSPLEIVVRLRVPATAAGTMLHLADFDLSYIGQESKLPEKVKASLEVEFAAAEVVDSLEENIDVMRAVRLLMNARARREAIEHLDRHDIAFAKMEIQTHFEATAALHSRAPSPELEKEMEDLSSLKASMDTDELMARKAGRYQSYNRRTGKNQ